MTGRYQPRTPEDDDIVFSAITGVAGGQVNRHVLRPVLPWGHRELDAKGFFSHQRDGPRLPTRGPVLPTEVPADLPGSVEPPEAILPAADLSRDCLGIGGRCLPPACPEPIEQQ